MPASTVDQHVEQLIEEGYTIIHDVLPSDEIELTKQAIDECLESEREVAQKYGLQDADLQMSFNVQGKHSHFYGLALRYPKPVQVIRRILGDEMFAHDVTIRKPLPTGKKDWTRKGGNLHADWADFTVTPFGGGNIILSPSNRLGPFRISPCSRVPLTFGQALTCRAKFRRRSPKRYLRGTFGPRLQPDRPICGIQRCGTPVALIPVTALVIRWCIIFTAVGSKGLTILTDWCQKRSASK